MAGKFSVITPVFNSGLSLKRTLKNIAALDQSAFEIIFVNDGSSDNSEELLEEYCKSHANARLINSEHRGVSSARNIGIENSNGDYILFLDADDGFFSEIFSVLNKHIDKNHPDILVFGAKINNYNSEFVLSDITPRNIIYSPFKEEALFNEPGARPYVWNCAYNTQFIKSKGIRFDEDITLGEDQLFQFTSFPQANVIQFISDKLYCYNYLERDSVIKGYIKDTFSRCILHVKLIDKVLEALIKINVYSSLKTDLLLWIYQFLKTDILSLKKYQFKIVASSLKTALVHNSIKINKMPLTVKKKLSYYSLINYSLCVLRRIIKR